MVGELGTCALIVLFFFGRVEFGLGKNKKEKSPKEPEFKTAKKTISYQRTCPFSFPPGVGGGDDCSRVWVLRK